MASTYEEYVRQSWRWAILKLSISKQLPLVSCVSATKGCAAEEMERMTPNVQGHQEHTNLVELTVTLVFKSPIVMSTKHVTQ